MHTSIDIIIVNWNSDRQLLQCLSSIPPTMPADLLVKVIVVDNASIDDSLVGIEVPGLPLTIFRNENNLGFAAACNQGARGSAAEYLLFLNPDTLLYEDSLVAPLKFLSHDKNKAVGIAGIQLVGDNGNPCRSCTRFPTPGMFINKISGLDRLSLRLFQTHLMAEWAHNESCDVDHVIGAFFMVRRSVFESLGGFDERYFVYLEDLDFSLRAKQAGWKTVFLTEAKAYHKGGGTSDRVKAKRLFYSIRSRLLYGYKHFSSFNASLLLLITFTIEPFARLLLGVLRFSSKDISETVKAYHMLTKDMQQMMKIFNKR